MITASSAKLNFRANRASDSTFATFAPATAATGSAKTQLRRHLVERAVTA
jgi:hypothetical protein